MPYGVATSLDGARLFVANQSAGSVAVLDSRDMRVLATHKVGRFPEGIQAAGSAVTASSATSGLTGSVRRRPPTMCHSSGAPAAGAQFLAGLLGLHPGPPKWHQRIFGPSGSRVSTRSASRCRSRSASSRMSSSATR